MPSLDRRAAAPVIPQIAIVLHGFDEPRRSWARTVGNARRSLTGPVLGLSAAVCSRGIVGDTYIDFTVAWGGLPLPSTAPNLTINYPDLG
jgi:hypothetical protein